MSKTQGLPSPYARAIVSAGEGDLLVSMMAEQGVNQWRGVAWIGKTRSISLLGKASGLRSDHVAAFATTADGRVWAATDGGLHLFDKGRFRPVGPSIPFALIAASPDGGLWAAGETALARVDGGTVKIIPLGKRVTRPLKLFARSRSQAWLVAQDALYEADAVSVKAVSLLGSPLYFAGPQRGERRMPHVWLYDAALGGDGRLYLVGATRKLTAWDGRTFSVLAEAHFARMSAVGHALYVTDFDNTLRVFDTSKPGGRPKVIFSGKGRLGDPWADSTGVVWVTVEPPSGQAHRMYRVAGDGTAIESWRLGRGGMLSPGVLATLPDGQGGLWMSTNDGVWHLRP